MKQTMKLAMKRAYEAWSEEDGFRVLVDRLWPRGISKEHARIDLWLKDIAPSTELRQWFGHDPEKWPEFEKRYEAELSANKEAVAEFFEQTKDREKVTLIFGAKDEEHNDAVVLLHFLEKRLQTR